MPSRPNPSESHQENSPLSRPNHNQRAVRITARKLPPSRPNHNQKVPQAVRITARKFPPNRPNHARTHRPGRQTRASVSLANTDLGRPSNICFATSAFQRRSHSCHSHKVPPSNPEPSESQPESSPLVRITTRKIRPSRPNHSQKDPVRIATRRFLKQLESSPRAVRITTRKFPSSRPNPPLSRPKPHNQKGSLEPSQSQPEKPPEPFQFPPTRPNYSQKVPSPSDSQKVPEPSKSQPESSPLRFGSFWL